MIDAKMLNGAIEPWTPRDIEAVCNGVAAIHAEDYAHRDLKPGNLLNDGRPVPSDFGSFTTARVRLESEAVVLQKEAVVHTTMSYRAPRALGPRAPADLDTAKANVLGLGCLL